MGSVRYPATFQSKMKGCKLVLFSLFFFSQFKYYLMLKAPFIVVSLFALLVFHVTSFVQDPNGMTFYVFSTSFKSFH